MPRHPHVVLITCHDLGGHIGCYGVSGVRTPTLDAMAADGVRFANSFCTSPGCSPSRAALATGRYPHANGVLGLAHAHFGWELGAGERHIASLLSEAGYHAVLFGLQHVTYHVERLGFREFRRDRAADEVAANLQRFLTERTGTEPLYLEINFFEPHRPFDFGGVSEDRTNGVTVPAYLPDDEGTLAELALMQGAIHKMDAAMATIQESLARAGILDDTLFVFTADHGIAFPRAKGSLYDAGIETALLIRWPAGGIEGGGVLPELISNVDLCPTMLELAGVAVPANVHGRSFATLLTGGDYRPRTEIFAEKTFHNEYDPLRCIRTSDRKLIVRFEVGNPLEVPADIMRGPTYVEMIPQVVERGDMPFELYDLIADPLERNNLAGKPEHAEQEADLKRRLREWMRSTGDPLIDGPIASPFYYRTLQALLKE